MGLMAMDIYTMAIMAIVYGHWLLAIALGYKIFALATGYGSSPLVSLGFNFNNLGVVLSKVRY
jgi:hypothetical protein